MLVVECQLLQTRVALFENDTLVEVQVENAHHRSVVGNVYKGRVNRILPGMQAAFLDVGLERDAFLYVGDVAASGNCEPPPSAAGADRSRGVTATAIEDLLSKGQEMLVQVTREPAPNKGARVTAHVSLPSRHLVLLPEVASVGVSRRIQAPDEQERLRRLGEALAPPGGGLILRTEAEGVDEEVLKKDLELLVAQWRRVRTDADSVAAPALVHEDLELAGRVARDLFGEDFDVLWVNSAETRRRVVDQLGHSQPELVERVKIDDSEEGLDRFRIDRGIEEALKSKVWLRSGGYLVINPTEALVAIDVNTGRYVGRSSLEETVVRTNLEAVSEIARQIRLRDLGGIIVIDFIDMEDAENRSRVAAALDRELERDRAKTRMLSISEFGLVEMTRKRSRSNLRSSLTRDCPQCRGAGSVRSLSSVCLEACMAVLHHRGTSPDGVRLIVSPEIAAALRGGERDLMEDLERRLAWPVVLESDSSFADDRYRIQAV